MTEDSSLTLERPPVVIIRGARKTDLPELNEMITLLASYHGDAAAITLKAITIILCAMSFLPEMATQAAPATSEGQGLFRPEASPFRRNLLHLLVPVARRLLRNSANALIIFSLQTGERTDNDGLI